MKTHALAMDMGGTNIRAALVDRDGRISERRSIQTRAHLGRDSVLERLLSELEGVSGSMELASLVGLGASVASPVDTVIGVLHSPPNLPGWDGYSIGPVLEERLSLTATVVNDANAAALAEHSYGAGRGYRNMVYLTVSTGIGGGIVVDGELYGGARGFAGEIGHMTIDRNGPTCNCGNVGCLEVLASGTAAARMARERLASGEQSAMLELAGGDPAKVDARTVAEAATSGDAVARAVMDEVSTNLGVGIVSLVHILDPDVIVIGGGMSQNLDMLLPGIERENERHALPHQRGRAPVVKAELGDDGGLLGAAAAAFAAYDAKKTP